MALQAPFSGDLTLILGNVPVTHQHIFLYCYGLLCYKPNLLWTCTHAGSRAINYPMTNIDGVGRMCECWQDDVADDYLHCTSDRSMFLFVHVNQLFLFYLITEMHLARFSI